MNIRIPFERMYFCILSVRFQMCNEKRNEKKSLMKIWKENDDEDVTNKSKLEEGRERGKRVKFRCHEKQIHFVRIVQFKLQREVKRFVRRRSISPTISLSFFFSSKGKEQRERERKRKSKGRQRSQFTLHSLGCRKGKKGEGWGEQKIRMSAKRICLSLFLKLTITRSVSALDDHANGSKERERKNTYLDRGRK